MAPLHPPIPPRPVLTGQLSLAARRQQHTRTRLLCISPSPRLCLLYSRAPHADPPPPSPATSIPRQQQRTFGYSLSPSAPSAICFPAPAAPARTHPAAAGTHTHPGGLLLFFCAGRPLRAKPPPSPPPPRRLFPLFAPLSPLFSAVPPALGAFTPAPTQQTTDTYISHLTTPHHTQKHCAHPHTSRLSRSLPPPLPRRTQSEGVSWA